MNANKWIDALSRFPERRVLIVGDLILDEYLQGDVQRVSPEAPVPVVEMKSRTHSPGGAANVAANIAGLGGQVHLAGVVGSDASARLLCDTLEACGLETKGLLVDPERPTTTKTRVLAPRQQVVRIDCEDRSPLPLPLADALLDWAEQQLPHVHACVLSDYGKGVVSARLAERFIRVGRRAGLPVIVDPKGTDYARYRGATVVKPNLGEAEQAAGCAIGDDTGLAKAGRRLAELLEGAAVLITRGPDGMSLFRPGVPPWHVAAAARKVFDVTGAGDTVVAALALALAAGIPLEAAVSLANRAAGVAVSKVGTAIVRPDELTGESC